MKLYNIGFFAVLFFCMSVVNAEWDPECISVDDEYVLEQLNSSELGEIKQQIFAHVKNSWCSEEKAKLLFELIVLTKPLITVEIGSFTGSSTFPMLTALKYVGKGKMYAIDPWSNEEAIRGLEKDDVNTVWWAGLNMQVVENQFIDMLNNGSFYSLCRVLRMTSKSAVSYVPAIDLLLLDGNFSEQGALLDTELYLPKVKSGGYIMLSNTLTMIAGKPTKMKALWPIFDQCDIVCELDAGNTILFKKH